MPIMSYDLYPKGAFVVRREHPQQERKKTYLQFVGNSYCLLIMRGIVCRIRVNNEGNLPPLSIQTIIIFHEKNYFKIKSCTRRINMSSMYLNIFLEKIISTRVPQFMTSQERNQIKMRRGIARLRGDIMLHQRNLFCMIINGNWTDKLRIRK